MEEKEVKTLVYELGFHLLPDVGAENVAKEFGDIKALIEGAGGTFISEEMCHEITLAYPMEKVINNKKNIFHKAFFGWIKFELSAQAISSLKEALDGHASLLRYLIVKTVRENTLAPKKILQKVEGSGSGRRERRERENAEPMNKEEVDREIDAMIGDEEKAPQESKEEVAAQ